MSVEAAGQIPPQASQTVTQTPAPPAKEVAPIQAAEIQAQTEAKVDSVQEVIDKLERAASQLNELMQSGQRSINFSIDKNANQVVVQVVDKTTQELVRQIPTPEALKLALQMESAMGMIFDRQI